MQAGHALHSLAYVLLKHPAHFVDRRLIEHNNPQVYRSFQLTYFNGHALLHIFAAQAFRPAFRQAAGHGRNSRCLQGCQTGNFGDDII
ncbi:hypothetical protein D3C75_1290500 [compost metagenome]